MKYIILVDPKTPSLLLELFYVPCFNVIKFFTFGFEFLSLVIVIPFVLKNTIDIQLNLMFMIVCV